jgi:large subunit ribosomal protein L47
VRTTQRAIKQVLTERYYAWQEAQVLARDDSEINLEADGGPIYVPRDYLDEEVLEEVEPEQIEARHETVEATPEVKSETRPLA